MIDQTQWRQFEGLMLRAKTLVDGLYSGAHPSPRRGPGLEFHDYRPYVPGDDLRSVDWKLYGRTDRYYVRRYRRYTDLQAYVLVDVSPSMEFAGTGLSKPEHSAWLGGGFGGSEREQRRTAVADQPRKLDLACQLSAAIAMLAVKQSDRIGLGLADQRLIEHRPPGSTWEHLQRLTARLEEGRADGGRHGGTQGQGTKAGDGEKEQARSGWARRYRQRRQEEAEDEQSRRDAEPFRRAWAAEEKGFGSAVHQVARLQGRRGLVVVISDLLDDAGQLLDALARLRHGGAEVIVLQVLTDQELDLNRVHASRAHMLDSETHASVWTHLPEIAPRYHELIGEHLAVLRRGCQSLGIDHTLVPTHQPPLEALRHYLTWRQSR